MSGACVGCKILLRQALYLLVLLLKFKARRLPVTLVAILLVPSNFWLFEALSRLSSSTEEVVAREIVNTSTFSGRVSVSSSGNFSSEINHVSALAASGQANGKPSWLSICDSPQSCNLNFYRELQNTDSKSPLARVNYNSEPFRVQLECDSEPSAELACPFLHQLVLRSLSPDGRLFRDVTFLSLTDNNQSRAGSMAKTVTICNRVESAGNAITVLTTTVLYHVLIATAGCMVHFTATTIAFIAGMKENGFLQLMFSHGLSVGVYWSVILVSIAVDCAIFSLIIGPCYGLQCTDYYPAGSALKLGMLFYVYVFSMVSLSLLATVLLRSFFLIVVSTVAVITAVVTITVVSVTRLLKMPEKDYLINFLLVFPPGHVTQYAIYILLPTDSISWNNLQLQYFDSVLAGMIAFPIVVTLLSIYVDFLLSSGNGFVLPPTYLFSPSFWCPRVNETVWLDTVADRQRDEDSALSILESVPTGQPAIYINNISVCYDRGCCSLEQQSGLVQALDSITCTVYRDQITALIGHNGAGKTTLIRVLTGELTPTTGTVVIGDRLVTNPYQRMALRRTISTCSKTNVLSQNLTVMESISLAVISKGLILDNQMDSVNSMLEQLGLADKKDVQAMDLSGGQLRKVCCIIALLGDPRVVILDEPTSGLDPVSRRKLWRILQDRQQGRCIILCTQFMDEADILADRKLFLSEGRLICAGSSLFLKHLFGCCPIINVSLRSSQDAQSFMQMMPRGVKELNRSGTELQLSVSTFEPDSSSDLHLLASVVRLLEAQQHNSLVTAFGVSQANLDEIFMRLKNVDTIFLATAIKNRQIASFVNLPKADEIKASARELTVDNSLLQLQKDYFIANKFQRSFYRTFASLLTMNLRRQVRSPVQALCRLGMPLVLLAAVCAIAYIEKNRYELSQSVGRHLILESGAVNLDDRILNSIRMVKSELVRLPLLSVDITDNVVCLYNANDLQVLAHNGCGMVKKSFSLLMKPDSVSVDEFVLPHGDQLNSKLQKDCSEICVLLYASSWNLTQSNSNRSLIIGRFWRKLKTDAIFKPMTGYFISMLSIFAPEKLVSKARSVIRMTTVVPFSQYYSLQMDLFVMVLLFSIIPVTFMADPIEDRSTCVRQQMRVMGLSSKVYWLNTIVIHWIQYAVFAILAGVSGLVWVRYQSTFLFFNVWLPMLFMGTLSNLLSVYCIGALQRTPSCSVLATYFFFVLFVLSVLTFVMKKRLASAICTWLVPPMAPMLLAFTGMKMGSYGLQYFERDRFKDVPHLREDFLAYSDTRHAFIAMATHVILLTALLVAIENWPAINLKLRSFRRTTSSTDVPNQKQKDLQENEEQKLENGVHRETSRILENPRSNENLLEVRGIETVYPNGVRALRGVTFGALSGEVFGLLGENGAGKTTLMSSIVGQLTPTRGEVEVRQIDGDWLTSTLGTELGVIGFCPQHDPLFKCVTVEEHLLFYARIRGISELLVPEQTDRLIRGLGLAKHRFKMAKELSGGSKRRLCLAIALLGCPSVVVIDEASTGVDPENKRAIWRAIRGLSEGGQRTVVVTTHSMEEVEALCSRVCIMYRGAMIGFGSVQQLRSRYGKALILEALLPPSQDLVELEQRKLVLMTAIQNQFKEAKIIDDVGASLQFQIPTASLPQLSDCIQWLADNKSSLNVKYFSLHQMSLDQIFVNMMRQHAEIDPDAVVSKSA